LLSVNYNYFCFEPLELTLENLLRNLILFNLSNIQMCAYDT